MARSRTVGIDISSRVKASRIAEPYLPGLAFMTTRAVVLEMVAAKGKALPPMRLEAGELAEEARLQLGALEAEIAEAPVEVSQHTRIGDLRAAITVVVGRLDRVHSGFL